MTNFDPAFRTTVKRCWFSGKVMFDKRSATTAANERLDRSHQELRIYNCPQCGTWHLTKLLHKKKYGQTPWAHNPPGTKFRNRYRGSE